MIFVSNEQRKTTDYQIKKASEYNKAHYVQIALRLSPEDAETVAKIATETRQSKNAVIISALHLYAQSLTAAETPTPDTATPETPSPAPEEISPGTVTGAEETQAGTHTETPAEDQQGKPQERTTSTPASPTSPESISPEQVAHIAQEAAQKAAQEAYKQGYIKARQEIRKELKAQQAAARIRATAKRIRAGKATGKARPEKIGKG